MQIIEEIRESFIVEAQSRREFVWLLRGSERKEGGHFGEGAYLSRGRWRIRAPIALSLQRAAPSRVMFRAILSSAPPHILDCYCTYSPLPHSILLSLTRSSFNSCTRVSACWISLGNSTLRLVSPSRISIEVPVFHTSPRSTRIPDQSRHSSSSST